MNTGVMMQNLQADSRRENRVSQRLDPSTVREEGDTHKP